MNQTVPTTGSVVDTSTHTSRLTRGLARSASGLVLMALLFVGACGGGAGEPEESTGPVDQTGDVQSLLIDYVTLAEPALSGKLTIGGPVRDLGDDETGDGLRIVLEFPLTDIPANATIAEANLSITFLKILGDPFGKLGNLQVVRIEYTPDSLGGEFTRPVLAHDETGDLTALTTPSRPSIDVTEVVASSFAASDARVRMRVQFPTPTSGDGLADLVSIATKIGSLPPPVLEVKYTTP